MISTATQCQRRILTACARRLARPLCVGTRSRTMSILSLFAANNNKVLNRFQDDAISQPNHISKRSMLSISDDNDTALPQNDLELALMGAIDNPTERPAFVRTLLRSEVYFFLGEHSHLWEFPDPWSVENNKVYKFPFFTSKDRLMEAVGVGLQTAVPVPEATMGVTGEAFFRMAVKWDNNVACMLSSGNLGFNMNFEVHEMEEIAAKGGLLCDDHVHTITQQDDAASNDNNTMTVIHGAPLDGQLPSGYKEGLQTFLSNHPKIRAAYCVRVRHTTIEKVFDNVDDVELALILEFDSETTDFQKHGLMEGVWCWSAQTYPGLIGSFYANQKDRPGYIRYFLDKPNLIMYESIS